MATFPSQKQINCPDCTLLNPYNATKCSCCDKLLIPQTPSTKSSQVTTSPISPISPLTARTPLSTINTNASVSNNNESGAESDIEFLDCSQLKNPSKQVDKTRKQSDNAIQEPMKKSLEEIQTHLFGTFTPHSNSQKRALMPIKSSPSQPQIKRRKIDSRNNNNNNTAYDDNNIQRQLDFNIESVSEISNDDLDMHNGNDNGNESDTMANISNAEMPMNNDDRAIIDSAHRKFFDNFGKGKYSRDLLEIHVGPGFCSKKMKKYNVLQIGSYLDDDLVEKKPIPRNDFPPYSMRFKHYGLYGGPLLREKIYEGCTPQIISVLKRQETETLGGYFLPRLRDESVYKWDNFILIRLDWNKFEAIYDYELGTDPYYDSLEHMINQVRDWRYQDRMAEFDNIPIQIMLESVEQRVSKINENRKDKQKQCKDVWCPFNDKDNLRNTLSKIEWFKDTNVQFQYVSGDGCDSKTKVNHAVKHVQYIANSLCKTTFERMEIRILSRRRNGRFRVGPGDAPPKNVDAWKNQLILVRGVSNRNATSIAKKYPSLGAYRKAWKRADDRERLLRETVVTVDNRKLISESVSKDVYEKFSNV